MAETKAVEETKDEKKVREARDDDKQLIGRDVHEVPMEKDFLEMAPKDRMKELRLKRDSGAGMTAAENAELKDLQEQAEDAGLAGASRARR